MPKLKHPSAEQIARLRALPRPTAAEWCSVCGQIIVAGEKIVPGDETQCLEDLKKSTVGKYLEAIGHA